MRKALVFKQWYKSDAELILRPVGVSWTDSYWPAVLGWWESRCGANNESGDQHHQGAGVQFRWINLNLLGDVATDDNGWLAASCGVLSERPQVVLDSGKTKKTKRLYRKMPWWRGSRKKEQNNRWNLRLLHMLASCAMLIAKQLNMLLTNWLRRREATLTILGNVRRRRMVLFFFIACNCA